MSAETLVAPLGGVALAKVANLGDYQAEDLRHVGVPIEEANVLTSLVLDEEEGWTGMSKVVLDIDLPAQLLPSSTPGHFHLLIDHEVEWNVYRNLLEALAEAGIVEEGFVGASVARGYTAVRLPWIRKAAEEVAE